MKKKKSLIFFASFMMFSLILISCEREYKYVPKGEFYVKTSPTEGDGGVLDVIDVEAQYKTYREDGDIVVPITIGFGHQPKDASSFYEGTSFYVQYQLFDKHYPTSEDIPLWENKVMHEDSYFDEKYNTTVPKDGHFLFIVSYGEFYPLYKEDAYIVFPKEVKEGSVIIGTHVVSKDEHSWRQMTLEFEFMRNDDILTLEGDE